MWDLNPRFDIFIDRREIESFPPHMQDFIARYSYPHLEMEGVVVVDSDNGRFMNHCLTPNTDFRVFDKGYALVDISQGDELTCNYHEFDPTFRCPSSRRCRWPCPAARLHCRPLIRTPARAGGMFALARPAAAAAAEAEPLRLDVIPYEGNVSLVYDRPSPERTTPSFSVATIRRNRSRDTVYRTSQGSTVGEPLTIALTCRSAEVALKGETATDEMSGFVFGVAKKIARQAGHRRARERGSGDRQNG